MSTVLDKLWELQNAVSELADRDRGLHTKPPGFAALDEEYQEANRAIEELSRRHEALSKERRHLEGELQVAEEKLRKYQGQLMQVKNQLQYAAAWKEIDVVRKQMKELEESLLKKMGEIEEVETELNGRRESHAGLKERFEAGYQEWQHSLSDLREDVARIRERVEAIESQIPERLRNEFHRIARQRHGIAVAQVVSGSCGACRFKLRSQAEQQIKRGEVVMCEGCRRIMYLEKAVAS